EAGGAPGDVCGVAVTQEEITFAGARTTAYSLQPDVAVVVDVTFATPEGTRSVVAFTGFVVPAHRVVDELEQRLPGSVVVAQAPDDGRQRGLVQCVESFAQSLGDGAGFGG
ncbi:MAG TPA: hypothetical protein DIW80_08400, partial [Gordonia polyisoprenivorans]|nr:hypothetical protein [Gordonia polyisoprenivorans]